MILYAQIRLQVVAELPDNVLELGVQGNENCLLLIRGATYRRISLDKVITTVSPKTSVRPDASCYCNVSFG